MRTEKDVTEKRKRGRPKKTSSVSEEKKPIKKKTTTRKKEAVAKNPIQKTTRKKSVKPNADESIAVSCCSTLKSSIAHMKYDKWEEVGSGDSSKMWFQIKGLMGKNNIAISKHDSGRKKIYTLYLLSTQGTEVTMEFSEFNYTHNNNKIVMSFINGENVIKHTVEYGVKDE